jgi:hypothetical protein
VGVRKIAPTSFAVLALAGAASGATPPASAPSIGFAGQDSRQSSVNPSDTQLAVGPTAVVQAVNTSVAVYSPSGQLLQQQTLGQFFSGGGVDRSRDSTTDPRVLWDPVSGRFFAVMFDITRLEIVLAMTITADPLGPRAITAFSSPGCTDQPRLGTSDNVVVITDDLFSSCTGFGRFVGGEIVVLNKQDLLNGVATPRRARFGPDPRFAAVTPATSLVSTQIEYLVAVSESNDALQVFSVPNSDVTSLPFKQVKLGAPFAETQDVPQRGSTTPVDPGDNRIQNAVFDAGRLWATSAVGCGVNRDCARIAELDPAVPHLVRETQVQLPNGRSLLYPALTPDSRGNLVLGFSYSSPNDFPGFGYTYVRPDGVVAAPVDVLPGTAPQNSGRFGDYSGVARDPGDPSRVWTSAQVGAAVNGSTLDWATGIAAASVPPQAPAIVSSLARAGRITAGVYAEGLPTTYRLEYGPTTAYGSRTAALPLPATAREAPVSLAAAGLPGSIVHARVVATNSVGTSFGADLAFRLPAGAPRVAAQSARRNGALTTLRAVVNAGGTATSVRFEFGASRAYGSRSTAKRVTGAVGVPVTATLRLRPGLVYHYRAVATNAKGTVRGPDRTVRT